MPRYRSRRIQSKFEIWLRSKLTARNFLIILIPVVIILIVAPVAVGLILQSIYSPRIYTDTSKVPITTVAVIPAAEILGVADNKADIKAVGQLYKAGKIQKLLLAGSHSDALDALQAEAIKTGVPAQNIKQDSASKRVYDMCYRLENVYSTNEVVIVSNNLDLPRILFICNSLKVSAKGFYLDEDHASASITDQLKHIIALAQSVWEVNGAAPSDLVKSEKLSL